MENTFHLAADQFSVVVVIPYYNGSKYIERAIKSVLAQSVAPREFIIVDDGSDPCEADFLSKLEGLYDFKLLRKSNGGQGSARNYGVSASVADYICFLDQDDFYLPNHIKLLVSAIPPNDQLFGFAYGDLFEADAEGNIFRQGMVKAHSSHPKKDIVSMIGMDMFVLPSASIINRKSFDAVGGFDTQFMGYEDDDLFLRIFRSGRTNYYIDEAVTTWCIHSESTSYSVKMSRSRWRYFNKLHEMFPDDESRSRYFLRDLLVPRFGPLFLKDAAKARLHGGKDSNELKKIYKGYMSLLVGEKNIALGVKLKVFVYFMIVSTAPRWFFSFAKKVSIRGRRVML